VSITPDQYRTWRATFLGAPTERLEQRLVFELAGSVTGKKVRGRQKRHDRFASGAPPMTYGTQSPTNERGCTATFGEVTAHHGSDENAGFLPRPSAGATVETTLTSVTPLHGSAKGTLVESFFDGGTGRTVTFTATF